jgi:hypothetical protein
LGGFLEPHLPCAVLSELELDTAAFARPANIELP